MAKLGGEFLIINQVDELASIRLYEPGAVEVSILALFAVC